MQPAHHKRTTSRWSLSGVFPRNVGIALGTLELCLAFVSLAGAPPQAERPAVLTGQVRDARTGDPLESVNVFLAGTTKGTTTRPGGVFRILVDPAGTYQLVTSRVGYATRTERVTLRSGDSLNLSLTLDMREITVDEVQIQAVDQEEWRRMLERFAPAFLGPGRNAEECRLVNPEVLTLQTTESGDTIRASCDSLLVIENRALGYRLRLLIVAFEWDVQRDVGHYTVFPRFEQLVPANNDEALRWAENRERTYRGSLRQFLHSAVRGNSRDAMFAVFSGRRTDLSQGLGLFVDPAEYVQGRPDDLNQISFSGQLRVEYRRTLPAEVSYIELLEPRVLVDARGNALNPAAIQVAGVWARRRVADLLPWEYE